VKQQAAQRKLQQSDLTSRLTDGLREFQLHPKQIEVWNDPARFKVIACGTKWGKTVLCIVRRVVYAWNNPEKISWWVAPVFPQTMIAYRRIMSMLPHESFEENRSERIITLKHNGHQIFFKSGDNPDSLFGEDVHDATVDEASRMKEYAGTALRTTLTATGGGCWYIFTPKGRGHWSHRLWAYGQDPEIPEYQSWRFPSIANPHLDPEEIEEARATLPESVFRQEYLAEFLDEAAAVFRNVDSCISPVNGGPQHGKHYVIGVDLGKHQDFTVLYVMDQETGQGLWMDRFGEIDWNLQKARIIAAAKRWNNAQVIMDSTGIGDPIYDDLLRSGITIQPYKFTNASKAMLIEKLMISLEQGDITIPPDPVLIEELKLFEYEITRTGKTSYNAPPGLHDDTVISLGLANWLLRKNTVSWQKIDESIDRHDWRPTMAGISEVFQ
jgi:hypothetical protein